MGKTRVQKPKGNGKPTDTPPDVLTLDAAAAFLHVTAAGLRADADNGHVPGRKVGGEWRFSRAGLLAWLAAPTPLARNARQVTSFGSMADDDTLTALVEDIYRRRAEEE